MMVFRGAVLASFIAIGANAQQKLGFVDLQRALVEVEEGRAAQARLRTFGENTQKEIEKDQEALKKEKDQFDKQSATMTETARRQKAGEFEKKMLDFNAKVQKFQGDMETRQRNEIDLIVSKMDPLVQSIAQREGFTMIFDKSRAGLVFAPAHLDLTNELIRMYNDQYKDAKAGAQAKPAQDGKGTGKSVSQKGQGDQKK
jgi:outer membrane protein